MKIILLLLAWLMLWFVHHRYTISHPEGIFYSNIGDFITAFIYQPLINLVLVLILILALGCIYSMLYVIIEKLLERKIHNFILYLIELFLTLYLFVLGFIYFTWISMVLFTMLMYIIIQNLFIARRNRIKRFRHF